MGALPFKEPEVGGYPVSSAARQRIDSARFNELVFAARRILADGGFSRSEIESIIDVVGVYWRENRPVDQRQVAARLHSKAFSKQEAEAIAAALAAG